MLSAAGDRPSPKEQAAMTQTAPQQSTIDRYFKITERGSTVGREIRGGLVTFFAMAYIIVLNPLIIGTVPDSTGAFLGGGDAPNLAMIAAATALVAGVVTILMGVFANFPLALATGLGLNAFVAFAIASEMTWADAMGLVVMEGLIILVLVLTGFRKAIFDAVPRALKVAISVGIGMFIAFIGLINGGFISSTLLPSPPVQLGIDGSLAGWPVVVFALGLVAVIVLYALKVKGAILWTIIGASILAVIVEQVGDIGARLPDGSNPTGWTLNAPEIPDEIVGVPDFGLLGQFSLLGSWEAVGILAVVLFVFTLLLADFFDTMGTMVAVGAEGDLLDEDGNPPNTQRILIVDSLAAAAGGAASVSSNTSYIESSAGVGDGARTGLASVVTGVCFLLATFLSPLVSLVPNEAAAPALVLVGFLMMSQIRNISWDDVEVAIPAFLAIVLMPFTFSISVGIGAGFVSYAVLKAARGKAREVHPLMWIVAVLFVIYFAIGPVQDLIGA
jgi:AGZA family xanthine/uracil permease-like MFS transporter